MRLGIATDHGGFGLKEELLGKLRKAGHEVIDFSAHTLGPAGRGRRSHEYSVHGRTDGGAGGGLGSRRNVFGCQVQQRPATSAAPGQSGFT